MVLAFLTLSTLGLAALYGTLFKDFAQAYWVVLNKASVSTWRDWRGFLLATAVLLWFSSFASLFTLMAVEYVTLIKKRFSRSFFGIIR